MADHSSMGKARSFSDCPFTLQLPQVYASADRHLVLDTTIMRARMSLRTGTLADTIAISGLSFRDMLNRIYEFEVPNAALLPGQNQESMSFPLDIPMNQIMIRDLSLVVEVLSAQVKYSIHYVYQSQGSVRLQEIERFTMSEEDRETLQHIIQEMRNPQAATESSEEDDESLPFDVPTSDYTGTSSSTDDSPADEMNGELGASSLPTMEEYSKAVFREMYFLQKNGGRQYKVTNGRFIDESAGYYCYSFDLETELHIADDSPIRLSVSGNTVDGVVLVCEGFQIILVVSADLGRRVSSAMLSAEPWRLLEKLGAKIRTINSTHQIAYSIAERGPTLRTNSGGEAIPKGQQAAYEHVDKNKVTVIWGPPGTGKTYVMSMIAMNAMRRGERVLIVSHSNTSVDGVIKATADRFRENGMDADLRQGGVLRYGYIRDEALAEDPYIVAFNYAINQMPDAKRRMEELKKERSKYQNQGGYSVGRRNVEAELKKVRMQVREREKIVASNARILATTISKVLVDPIFDDAKYDLVMFDEISMAYVSQLVVAASYASKRFVCVGDFRQLAPIAQSESRRTLCTDIFTYLGINRKGRIYAHPWLVMLNEQRRMHPAISRFPNQYVYQKLLVDHESVIHGRDAIAGRAPIPGEAMQLIDLTGTFCAAMKNQDNSRFNILSAIVSFGTALQAQKSGETDIGIITPYAAQARLISAMLRDDAKSDRPAISSATVHQFQGSERNVIVFDAVESYPNGKIGMLLSNNENNAVTRLINVAMTRARGKFITVANSKFWKNKSGDAQNIYCQLLEYLQNHHLTTSTGKERALQQYVDTLDYGSNIKRYIDNAQALERLKKDIDRAKDRIIVSLPDGQREAGSPILDILRAARVRGIRVMCKAQEYKNLPADWKDNSYASDNAVFPLIVIDEDVVWYGLPEFTGQFTDKEWKYMTIFPLIYRIQGQHTVSMICSLTDIEYREWKDVRSVLEEKVPAQATTRMSYQTSSGDDGQQTGLAGYVQRNVRCTKCRKPTELKKGFKSGKIYLKCPSCGNMDYLLKDDVNLYIEQNGITCPQHHCELRAGLGKYGLYVRCDMGHFLKPDEI